MKHDWVKQAFGLYSWGPHRNFKGSRVRRRPSGKDERFDVGSCHNFFSRHSMTYLRHFHCSWIFFSLSAKHPFGNHFYTTLWSPQRLAFHLVWPVVAKEKWLSEVWELDPFTPMDIVVLNRKTFVMWFFAASLLVSIWLADLLSSLAHTCVFVSSKRILLIQLSKLTKLFKFPEFRNVSFRLKVRYTFLKKWYLLTFNETPLLIHCYSNT